MILKFLICGMGGAFIGAMVTFAIMTLVYCSGEDDEDME